MNQTVNLSCLTSNTLGEKSDNLLRRSLQGFQCPKKKFTFGTFVPPVVSVLRVYWHKVSCTPYIDSRYPLGTLTKGVGDFCHRDGESAPSTVYAEEDHGHVLRGAYHTPGGASRAVVYVALIERVRVVLGTGKLLSFKDPAVKYLHGGYTGWG